LGALHSSSRNQSYWNQVNVSRQKNVHREMLCQMKAVIRTCRHNYFLNMKFSHLQIKSSSSSTSRKNISAKNWSVEELILNNSTCYIYCFWRTQHAMSFLQVVTHWSSFSTTKVERSYREDGMNAIDKIIYTCELTTLLQRPHSYRSQADIQNK
jgi:hypothetical protein